MRFAARKRPLAVLEVAARARDLAGGGVPMRLTLFGEGPERGRLERFAERHAMADWVSLPGRVGRDELRKRYWDSDVYLTPPGSRRSGSPRSRRARPGCRSSPASTRGWATSSSTASTACSAPTTRRSPEGWHGSSPSPGCAGGSPTHNRDVAPDAGLAVGRGAGRGRVPQGGRVVTESDCARKVIRSSSAPMSAHGPAGGRVRPRPRRRPRARARAARLVASAPRRRAPRRRRLARPALHRDAGLGRGHRTAPVPTDPGLVLAPGEEASPYQRTAAYGVVTSAARRAADRAVRAHLRARPVDPPRGRARPGRGAGRRPAPRGLGGERPGGRVGAAARGAHLALDRARAQRSARGLPRRAHRVCRVVPASRPTPSCTTWAGPRRTSAGWPATSWTATT